MKRTSAIVLAIGTVGFLLAGCGGADESSDANGLRKGASSTTTPTAPLATPNTGIGAPVTTKKEGAAALGPASSTTCGEFKKLDTDGEKALIEQILAENPGGRFEGSPNVALGTAKLVCLSPSVGDTAVAVAAGIVKK
ncbi:hypothetical protein [Nocardia sp. R6R-6]|uniref:hypothetical protein n=1 Tax=Nocardia sp. R6R-6 TaxID=3459303 RepID=UPI00403D78F1